MGVRISRLVDRIRSDMGPFFVARLCLRVNVRIDDKAPDTPEAEEAIIRSARELGYDFSSDPVRG
jgi:hypothetical protein